jgi:2,3-dihydroxybenzoate-AMP ligase
MSTVRDERLPRHERRLAERYLASGAWSREPTVARFRAVVAEHRDRDAVVGLDDSLTYADLDERTERIAAWLIRSSLPLGAPVVVQVGNSAESVIAFYALLKAGAVPVAALAAHRSHEIDHISSIVDAAGHLVDSSVSDGILVELARDNAHSHPLVQHLFTVGPAPEGFVRLVDAGSDLALDEARDLVDGVQARLHHEDVVVFQLSGGTTGTPKVIPRLHAEYWNNAVMNSAALQRTPESRVAHVMPILHNAGVTNALIGAHAVGGCVVALPFLGTEESLRNLIAAGTNDMMIGSPMAEWLEHPLWDTLAANLKVLIFSGSKLPLSVVEQCASQGIWLGQTWGMAEGPYTSTRRTDPARLRAESVGTPVHGIEDEMLVVDITTHTPLPLGETGMLVYRGPSTLAGYFDAPKHNAVAFTADGLLLTGDLAKLVEHEGSHYLSIEGRIKDVISRGGEKFSTEEVENLLLRHPAIVQAAVVAMPDVRLGERGCAYLVTAPGVEAPSLTDVQRHFASLGVAKFKWPERLEFLDALPRTHTFKVDKLRLRTLIAEQVAAE